MSQRADVSVQTIYNRVGGRPALLIATCEKELAELDGYMNTAFASSGSVIERLYAVIDAYARFAREKPVEFRILAERPDDAGALATLETKTATEDNLVEALLREGIQDGSLDPATNPALTARVLWASMNGVLGLAWRAGNIPLKLEDQVVLVREASRLYCRSLLAGHLIHATNG
jgi:AcrR family transcriptional regulator